MNKTTHDIGWEIMNTADYFGNDVRVGELTTRQLANQIVRKIAEDKNINVSFKRVLNVIIDN